MVMPMPQQESDVLSKANAREVPEALSSINHS